MTKRRALITGASSGIGLELARLFAADGHDLVLVARREAKLRALADSLRRDGLSIEIIADDLADPAAPGRIVAALEQRGLTVDILVNNAGFGSNGKFVTTEREGQVMMIDVNCRALVDLTHRLLPGMLARGFGRVLNIGSTAGFQPGPNMATYYATKAFVNHFSEAIAHELRGTGVTVTVHCPGPTQTEFADVANMHKTRLFAAIGSPASAADVARDAYRAMSKGKVIAIHGALNWFATFMIRFTPRALARTIAGWISTAPE